MEDEDFTSDAESINGENDDDFNMNSEENNSASLDPHSSEDKIDEAELVKTYKHFRQDMAARIMDLSQKAQGQCARMLLLVYLYQMITTAISFVARICYAHLAVAQVCQFIKFDEMSEMSSSHDRQHPHPGVVPSA